MKNQFRIRLKELRKEKKVIQTKLGKHLGFGYTAIANYESGRNEPSLDTLIQIADYFDVTLDYLLGRDDLSQKEEYNQEEYKLLKDYRRLTQRERAIILDMVKILSERRQ